MFSLNATLPVFLVIVLGWFLMQKKMFNENFVDIINKFVFKVSLPVLLFKDIATTPIRDAFDPKFVIFCMVGTTIMFMGIWALTSIFMKDKSMALSPRPPPGAAPPFLALPLSRISMAIPV